MRSLLRGRLDALDAAGSLRRPDAEAGSGQASGPAVVDRRLDLSSNDYLGLGRRNVSRETLDAIRHAPPGGRASRLIFGTHAAHLELERELANWVQQPAALLFSSGYAANVGTLAALAGPGDVVFSDALNHTSNHRWLPPLGSGDPRLPARRLALSRAPARHTRRRPPLDRDGELLQHGRRHPGPRGAGRHRRATRRLAHPRRSPRPWGVRPRRRRSCARRRRQAGTSWWGR